MRQNAFADWKSDGDLEKLLTFFSKNQRCQAGIMIEWLFPIFADNKAQSELHEWLQAPARRWRTHTLSPDQIGDFFQDLDSIALKTELPAQAPKDVLNVCIDLLVVLLTESVSELLGLLKDAANGIESPAVAFLIYSLSEICEQTIRAGERFKAIERNLARGNPGLN
jgi:hypothetical protein